tara:strand:+ start:1874 stop:3169 length:1296 start_codon:yes stop_codon:yes gene_type:complete
MDEIQLFNDDCFNVFPKLEPKSVSLFVLDLPYNITACKWDKEVIPLDKMWENIKRVMKPDGIVVMFCTTKFGYSLIHSNPKWFRYDIIWKKSRKVGFLNANKMPLRQHENIYIFKEELGTYNPQKTEGKPYKSKGGNTRTSSANNRDVLVQTPIDNKGDRHPTSIIEHENIYIFKEQLGTYNPQKTEGKPYKRQGGLLPASAINSDVVLQTPMDNKGDRHPTSIIEHENIYIFKEQLGTYNPQKVAGTPYKVKGGNLKPLTLYARGVNNQEIIQTPITNNGDRYPSSIIDHENIYIFKDKLGTYNPQKTKGKPYNRVKDGIDEPCAYGEIDRLGTNNVSGDRHPSSLINYEGDTVVAYNNPSKSVHKTQKPVELCEWLIKTYSNEGETIMDFTMGSGTTGVACLNTKRKFIGVEKDEEIFKIAEERIKNHI